MHGGFWYSVLARMAGAKVQRRGGIPGVMELDGG